MSDPLANGTLQASGIGCYSFRKQNEDALVLDR